MTSYFTNALLDLSMSSAHELQRTGGEELATGILISHSLLRLPRPSPVRILYREPGYSHSQEIEVKSQVADCSTAEAGSL